MKGLNQNPPDTNNLLKLMCLKQNWKLKTQLWPGVKGRQKATREIP